MPTYTYVCKKCGHTFDVFHSISGTHKIPCEKCASLRTERQLGIGSGIIFKGSGFYETDYKTKKGTPPAGEGKAGETKSGDSKSGESKPGDAKKAETKKSDTGGGTGPTAPGKKASEKK